MAARRIVTSGEASSIVPLASALLISLLAESALAQYEQIYKLTAENGAREDHFGWTVSIAGDLILVGAFGNDHAGSESGAAYVFDAATGLQMHMLTASDAAAADHFGCSLDVRDDLAIVGACGKDLAGPRTGCAYIFDAVSGEELRRLSAGDAAGGDSFGRCVAMCCYFVIAGAPGDDDAGDESGSAYVFGPGTGEQLFKFIADDAAPRDGFGSSVSISRDTAVVGAMWNDGAGHDAGAAYVFDLTIGQELYKLTASDAKPDDLFGRAVAISQDRILVGAPGSDSPTHSGCGAAYLFDLATGQELFKLVPGAAADCDVFGCSVALDGDLALIGASGDDDGASASGSVYVFELATGRQICKLTASDAATDDRFGHSAAISGILAVIGAVWDDDQGIDSGSAYLFRPCESRCPADFDDSFAVDLADLFGLLAAWGPCDGCPEDLNDDGMVNIDDIIILLAAWGPCE